MGKADWEGGGGAGGARGEADVGTSSLLISSSHDVNKRQYYLNIYMMLYASWISYFL